MQKIRKRHLSILAITCMMSNLGLAQGKGGMENYNILRQGESSIWMPVLHYQTIDGVYSELRYNYEELKTFSIFAGKTFTAVKKTIDIIPMIGFSTGNFTGVSFAADFVAERNNFFFSLETQYSVSLEKSMSDFFFSWAEIGYSITPNLFAGFSFQYTQQVDVGDPEAGFMAGILFKNISIPLYVFNPFKSRQYIVLGLHYDYHFKKKNKLFSKSRCNKNQD